MIAALDSNVMIYAEGMNDEVRRDNAHSFLAALGKDRIVLPLQAVGEMTRAHIRVGKKQPDFAAERARAWMVCHKVQETTLEVFEDALELSARHRLQLWDSIILSAAAVAGASVLLSEDMQNGFRWREVTIINPFAFTPRELIEFMSLSVRH